MSSWTYVYGLIEADTYARSDAEAIYIAQTVIDHLPKITGSERNASTSILLSPGYNCSSSHDEFDNYQPNGMKQHQSRAMIVIQGDLRDRLIHQTIQECAAFVARLSKRLSINGGCLKVVGGCEPGEIDVMRGKWWDDNWEWENNWTEFLRWKMDEN